MSNEIKTRRTKFLYGKEPNDSNLIGVHESVHDIVVEKKKGREDVLSPSPSETGDQLN
jgi:hypothetical protein